MSARYRRIRNCTPLHADGYAHHPYDLLFGAATGSPLSKTFPGADNAPIETLPNLRKALDKLAGVGALATPGGKPLNIYLTESGYFVSGKRKLGPAKRAKYLPQQFQVAAAQYNVFVPSSGFTTGRLTLDGRPLAEYKTLLAWTRRAAKGGLIKRNTGPITLPPAPLS